MNFSSTFIKFYTVELNNYTKFININLDVYFY